MNMRKILRQIFVTAMAVVMSLSFISVKANAKTVTEAVNGGVATLICAVNSGGARAETQCRAGGAKVSVSATYSYEDKAGNPHTTASYVNDVTLTAQVLFEPSSGGKSLSVRSKHTVVVGGRTTEVSLIDRMPELDGGPDCS